MDGNHPIVASEKLVRSKRLSSSSVPLKKRLRCSYNAKDDDEENSTVSTPSLYSSDGDDDDDDRASDPPNDNRSNESSLASMVGKRIEVEWDMSDGTTEWYSALVQSCSGDESEIVLSYDDPSDEGNNCVLLDASDLPEWRPCQEGDQKFDLKARMILSSNNQANAERPVPRRQHTPSLPSLTYEFPEWRPTVKIPLCDVGTKMKEGVERQYRSSSRSTSSMSFAFLEDGYARTRSSRVWNKGTIVRKRFGDEQYREGELVAYDPLTNSYLVRYLNGDTEEYTPNEVTKHYKENQSYCSWTSAAQLTHDRTAPCNYSAIPKCQHNETASSMIRTPLLDNRIKKEQTSEVERQRRTSLSSISSLSSAPGCKPCMDSKLSCTTPTRIFDNRTKKEQASAVKGQRRSSLSSISTLSSAPEWTPCVAKRQDSRVSKTTSTPLLDNRTKKEEASVVERQRRSSLSSMSSLSSASTITATAIANTTSKPKTKKTTIQKQTHRKPLSSILSKIVSSETKSVSSDDKIEKTWEKSLCEIKDHQKTGHHIPQNQWHQGFLSLPSHQTKPPASVSVSSTSSSYSQPNSNHRENTDRSRTLESSSSSSLPCHFSFRDKASRKHHAHIATWRNRLPPPIKRKLQLPSIE